MNNIQRAKLDTCNRVKEYNTKYATNLATITEYATEKTAFDNAYTIINNATQVQARTTGATTDAVEKAKQTMVNTTVKFALRAAVKAKQLGNLTLANHLNHPITYFSNATKTLAVQRAKEIKQQLTNNLATLTNITAANITDITNAINTYDTIKDSPILDNQAKTASGTNALPPAFAAAFNAIDNMHDLITSYFFNTANKHMVDEFALAKQIITTGIHHTGVEGTITKSGKPLIGTKLSILGTDKQTQTDKDGHYLITKIQPGDYTIQVNINETDTQTKNIYISKGSFAIADFNIA